MVGTVELSSSPLSPLQASAPEFGLPLRCVAPPRLGRLAAHKAHGRYKNVDHTRVVALARNPTKRLVHSIRVAPEELFGRANAKETQVSRTGGADVG